MTKPIRAEELPARLLFFDGLCVMCNGLVKWLVRIDRERQFHFASLQGEAAATARQRHPEMPAELETMVYLEDGEIYLRSRGVLKAASRLPYPWRALSWFRVLPRFITDLLYRLIARSRYRVFGQYEQCPVPPVEDRARFLP